MSFASKFNRGKFTTPTTGFEYKKLGNLYNENGKDKKYRLVALYISTKGNYGKQAIAAIEDKFFVNLPKHIVSIIESMLNDDDTIKDINLGKCGFTIYRYESHGKMCFSVKWLDMQATKKENSAEYVSDIPAEMKEESQEFTTFS